MRNWRFVWPIVLRWPLRRRYVSSSAGTGSPLLTPWFDATISPKDVVTLPPLEVTLVTDWYKTVRRGGISDVDKPIECD